MLVCKQCGKENQDHYRFCLGCGTEVVAPGLSTIVDAPKPVAAASPVRAVPAPSRPGRASTGSGASASDYAGEPGTAMGVGKYGAVEEDTSPAGVQASAALDDTMVCPACGADAAGFTFCGQCGTRLSGETKPVPRRKHNGVPAAAKPARGKLVLIRPDGTEGGTHPLSDGSNAIGRGTGSLFDADNYLSPQHAELALTPSGMVVRDLDSLNGVFVKLTDEEELSHADVFRIGQELLRFDAIHAPEPLDDGTEVMGSPNPGYWGRVALIIGKGQDGSAFPLFGDAVILGRERGDILFPEDGYVSGTHARLSIRGERFYLTDMNSSNGTFLRIRGERALRSGSFVLMGQQLFRVQYA